MTSSLPDLKDPVFYLVFALLLLYGDHILILVTLSFDILFIFDYLAKKMLRLDDPLSY
jgi:hypothetical protein